MEAHHSLPYYGFSVFCTQNDALVLRDILFRIVSSGVM